MKSEIEIEVIPQSKLSEAEQKEFSELEKQVEPFIASYVTAGIALATIKDKKLYRENYTTFAEYMQDKWKLSHRRANQLIDAAEVAQKVEPLVPLLTERVAREVSKAPKSKQKKVAKAIAKHQKKIGKPITAKDVEKIVTKVAPRGGLAAEYSKIKQIETPKKSDKSNLNASERVEIWWAENRLKLLEHPAISCDGLVKRICEMLRKAER